MTIKTFKLNTGASMPGLGLATWPSPRRAVAYAVYDALKAGYRHIDGALCYQNEDEVGEGLKKAFDEGICTRSEVFVTTKLWNTYHRHVQKGLDESLASLGLDYIDLYLMHWPVAMNDKGNHPLFPRLEDDSRDIDHERTQNWTDTYADMEKLLDTGKVKAIGMSNCSAAWLEKLLKVAKITPAVNQIEHHPYLPQDDVLELCHKNGIVVTAYSNLWSTNSPLLKDEALTAIARKRNVSVTSVLLGWGGMMASECSVPAN